MSWTTPQPEWQPSVDALIAQLETMLRQRRQRQRAVMHPTQRERAARNLPPPVVHHGWDQPEVPAGIKPVASARAEHAKTPATEKALAAASPRGACLRSSHSSLATTRWRRGVVSNTHRTAQRPAHATPWACKRALPTNAPCRALSCPQHAFAGHPAPGGQTRPVDTP